MSVGAVSGNRRGDPRVEATQRNAWALAQSVFAATGLVLVLAPHTLWWAGLATLVQGLWWFWWHGRQRITAAGLYSLGSGIFVGYAAMWWATAEGAEPPGLYLATIIGFALSWVLVFWWPQTVPTEHLRDTSASGTFRGATFSVLASVAGLTVLLYPQGQGAAFSQIVLGALGAFAAFLVIWRTGDSGSHLRLGVAGAVVLLYTQLVFTGYGRLNIVALGLGAVIIVSLRSRTRWLKALSLAAIGPALLVFSLMRADFLQSKFGSSAQTDGPGSVVTPLRDFGGLLERGIDGSLAYGHGDSFVATAVFWVPRSSWPDKPVGFGAQLVQVLRPDLAALNNGQTFAALNQGEWWYAFGWWGLALMLVVIGLYVRLLDRLLERVGSGAIDSPVRLSGLLVTVFLVADIPNLVWVGTSGYVSRVTLRLVPVLMIMGLVLVLRTRRQDGRRPKRRGTWAAVYVRQDLADRRSYGGRGSHPHRSEGSASAHSADDVRPNSGRSPLDHVAARAADKPRRRPNISYLSSSS